MYVEKDSQLKEIRGYVYNIFQHDVTGHDFYHMKRVAMLAKEIAVKEQCDPFICEASAWLHDIGDRKLFINPTESIAEMNAFLASIYISDKQIKKINEVISTVSFQKGLMPSSIAGKIVQDADRLDAIGAIGIARVFQFGGANNQMIHESESSNTSIQHFYDKLLKIKDLIHTESARKIAEERHAFMERFLKQFYNEW